MFGYQLNLRQFHRNSKPQAPHFSSWQRGIDGGWDENSKRAKERSDDITKLLVSNMYQIVWQKQVKRKKDIRFRFIIIRNDTHQIF